MQRRVKSNSVHFGIRVVTKYVFVMRVVTAGLLFIFQFFNGNDDNEKWIWSKFHNRINANNSYAINKWITFKKINDWGKRRIFKRTNHYSFIQNETNTINIWSTQWTPSKKEISWDKKFWLSIRKKTCKTHFYTCTTSMLEKIGASRECK